MNPAEPSGDQVRDVYASFGLAYYFSEVLHRQLCHIVAMVGLPAKHLVTRPRIEERLERAYTLTLGDVITELRDHVPASLKKELEEAKEARNYLAHRFWFEQIHLTATVEGIGELITMLDKHGRQYVDAGEKAHAWFQGLRPDLDIPGEVLEAAMQRVLAGTDDPLIVGDKAMGPVKRTYRGKRQLVRVWSVPRPNETGTLIFEFGDGTFGQLCDVGFVQTGYDSPDDTWTEQRLIKVFLPATVALRPDVEQPWTFSLRLRRGAVFWVRPGEREGTF